MLTSSRNGLGFLILFDKKISSFFSDLMKATKMLLMSLSSYIGFVSLVTKIKEDVSWYLIAQDPEKSF